MAGVKVGTIASIEPVGTQAKMTMHVDRDVPIPADAKAVIVAQNLVAQRYLQLTPAYRSTGPKMADGAVIPLDRTAVPVEWDEVKAQLMRLATELGPSSNVSTPSVARFIDSAANALEGNGDKLRQTLAQLSGVGRILAEGSGNIADIIKNLQTFVTALRDSNQQIVQFENRLATLTSVLNDSRSDLDAALSDLSVAVGEVRRFIAGSRDQTSEQIRSLAEVTQNLADHRIDLENVLHIAPTAFSNFYNIYNPDSGSNLGGFVFNNLSNPAPVRLRRHRSGREHHRAGNSEAVRAVRRTRIAIAHLELQPHSDQPVPGAGADPGALYRGSAEARCHQSGLAG